VRARYYQDYRGSWGAIQGDLNKLAQDCAAPTKDCPSGSDFKQGDTKAVADQLYKEVSALNRVQHYLGTEGLQAAFGTAQTAAIVDLKDIGQKVQNSVNPPPADNTASNTFLIMSYIIKLGGFLPPPGSNIAAGTGALFGMIAYFTRSDGSPNVLGQRVQATVDRLGPETFNRYNAASQQFDAIGQIIVSDPSKLNDVAGKVDSDPNWVLGNKGKAFDQMRLGTQRFFYQTLLPVGYQLWEISPAPPGGPANARDYTCFSSLARSGAKPPGSPNTSRPFGNEPDSGQDRQITAFGNDGSSVAPVIGLAFNVNTNPFGVPPASITDPLFRDPDDPRGGGLGFTKPELYSPRYFTFKGPLRNDQRCPYG